MCVSGVRSGAVSCERVCVSCEWASRRSSVVRREAFSFVFVIPKFSCRVLNSSFSFEFVVEFSIRISSSSSLNFRVVFWSRISNSSFSFRYSIRFLESDFEFVVEFDFSNVVSNFKFECVVEISRRNFRFVALFDFSNFVALFDFSNFNFRFEFRFEFRMQVPWIWWFEIVVEIFDVLLYSTSRNRSSNSTSRKRSSNSISRISSSRLKCLEFRIRLFVSNLSSNLSSNFEFVLISSTSRIVVEICVALFDFSKSHSSFEFFIELRNFRCSSIKKPNFCAKLQADVANYSRTSALASLSLSRELCARFSCVKY